MMPESADDLIQLAITALRAGRPEQARHLLARVLRDDPRNETAWLWLTGAVQSREERIHCLRQVLKINPANPSALKGLHALGVEAPAPAPEAAPPEPSPEQPAAYLPPDSTIPVITEETLARTQSEVRGLLERLEQEQARGARSIDWAMPSPGRVPGGFVLPSLDVNLPYVPRVRITVTPRLLLIAGGSALLIITLLGGTLAAGASLRRARQEREIAAALTSQPTLTPSLTPTITVTPRATRTPLPEGFDLTPEPSLAPGNAPRGDLRFGMTPTPLYIATPHPASPLTGAIAAYTRGDYTATLSLIEEARAAGEITVDAAYYEGMALFALGRTDEALAALLAGERADSQFAPVQAALGLVYARQGAVERARAANERARTLDPLLLMAYLNQADLYLVQGDTAAAQAEIDAARTSGRYEYNVDLLVLESRIALATEEPERALALAKLAHYIDPGAEPANVWLGRARLAAGFADRALVDLEDYVFTVNPSSAEGWLLLAGIYREQSRAADALEAYARAVQLSPSPAEALTGRGEYYLAERRFALAYADFDAALTVDPQSREARMGRAESAFALGLYDEALADAEAIRDAEVPDPMLEVLAIRTLAELGQYGPVIDRAQAALALDLSDVQAARILEARARAYEATGALDLALADANRALELDESGLGHYVRGAVLAAQGQTESAIRDLEWTRYWADVFGYPFAADLDARLDRLYRLRAAAAATPTPGAP
ncbi:MAG: tetratricopeptide repeat protein [Anaerolineae bacterium]|nr:tetratricopeptide repeat protein [Anaerolineae bacterium]